MTDEERKMLLDARRFLKYLVSVLDVAVEQTKYDDEEVSRLKHKAWEEGYELGLKDAQSLNKKLK